MLEGLISLIILGIITIAANFALEDRTVKKLLYLALILTNAIFFVLGFIYLAMASLSEETLVEIGLDRISSGDPALAALFFGLSGLVATALLFKKTRLSLVPLFPKRTAPSVKLTLDGALYPSNPNAKSLQGFDPHSPVHMTALIFTVYIMGSQFASLAVAGGLDGIAEDIKITWGVLIGNFLPLLIIPLLGVGLAMRRTWPEVLDRLGLRHHKESYSGFLPPFIETLIIGFVTAFMMLIAVVFLGSIWQALASPESFETQTEASGALSESITTIWLALGVATTAAIGEEIAFRGAFQPIFGLWVTAIVFTLTHIQYALTPATLIIFVVALALGWLREQFSLYACILAHFVYNFILLAIAVALS